MKPVCEANLLSMSLEVKTQAVYSFIHSFIHSQQDHLVQVRDQDQTKAKTEERMTMTKIKTKSLNIKSY